MAVRRWECPSSSGGKFWEVSQEDKTVSVRWGKLNAKGSSKSTIHESVDKATKFIETTIKKKEKEGYTEKVTKTVAKEPAKKAATKKIAPAKVEPKKTTTTKKVKKAPKVVSDDEEELEESEEVPDEPVPSSYVLPVLYNTDAKGKERVYKIWVVKNKVTKMHGETKGKQTLAERSYEGKNVGRSNETDANEQACREAERDWVKQTDKLYKPKTKDVEGMAIYKKVSAEKVKQGGVNTNTWTVLAKELRGVIVKVAPKSKAAVATAKAKEKKKAANGAMPGYKCDLFPMGCQKLALPTQSAEELEPKVLKYLNFDEGVYVQRKLDGIRCLVRIVEDPNIEGKKWVVMMSRQGNQFVHLKSLREEVLTFLKGHEDVILDCEVYAHEIFASVTYKKEKVVFGEGDEPIPRTMLFKAISSTVRSTMTEPGVLEEQMNLYVFDIVDPTEQIHQDERFAALDKLFKRKGISEKCPKIIQVERFEINSPEEITPLHDQFAEEGYEGVVIRDKKLKYECLKKNKKSKWMRKYKYFLDSEYPIQGVKRDKGVPREQFTWICETEDGVKFYPKPEGTREMKWEWFDNKEDFLGKMLTVRYQGLEESGKPRFPIGVSIRDYE